MILMSNNTEQLKLMSIIQHLREEMVQTGLKEGLNSKNTLILSQKLDEYIAKYQSSMKNY